MEELLGVALRVSIMYIFALTLLRLAGKRAIGDLSPLDFVVTLVIGDMFDDFFWAEIPLSQAAVGMTTIIFLHLLVAFGSYKSIFIERLVNSRETLIIKSGQLRKQEMRKEHFGEEEVFADLRLHGEDGLEEIDESYLEPSGHLSMVKKDEARTIQKRDLSRLLELLS